MATPYGCCVASIGGVGHCSSARYGICAAAVGDRRRKRLWLKLGHWSLGRGTRGWCLRRCSNRWEGVWGVGGQSHEWFGSNVWGVVVGMGRQNHRWFSAHCRWYVLSRLLRRQYLIS